MNATCKYCGAPLRKDYVLCEYCGRENTCDEIYEQPEKETIKQSGSGAGAFVVALALTLLGFALITAFCKLMSLY